MRMSLRTAVKSINVVVADHPNNSCDSESLRLDEGEFDILELPVAAGVGGVELGFLS